MLKDEKGKISMYIRFLQDSTVEVSRETEKEERSIVFKKDDFPMVEAKILKSLPSMIAKLPYISSPDEFNALAYEFANIGSILLAHARLQSGKFSVGYSTSEWINASVSRPHDDYEVTISVYDHNDKLEFRFRSVSEVKNKAYYLAKKLYLKLLNAEGVDEYNDAAKLAGTIAGLLLASPQILEREMEVVYWQ